MKKTLAEQSDRRIVDVMPLGNRPVTSIGLLESRIQEAQDQLGQLRGSGPAALSLLAQYDAIADQFETLRDQGADVAVADSRWQTLQETLDAKKRLFVAEVGRKQLRAARQAANPQPDRWWWYLDEISAAEARQRMRKALTIFAILALFLFGGWYMIHRYEANRDPREVARERYEMVAESALEHGEWTKAKEAYDRAQTYAPDDGGILLVRGVLADKLGDHQEAEHLYRQARTEGKMRPADFLWQQGTLFLQTKQLAAARRDAEAMLQADPQSAEAHFLAAAVHEAAGEYAAASREYTICSQLADKQGKASLQAMAKVRNAYLLQYHPVAMATPAGP